MYRLLILLVWGDILLSIRHVHTEIFRFGISFSSEKYIYLVTPEIRFYFFRFLLKIAFVRKSKLRSNLSLKAYGVCRMFEEDSTEQLNWTPPYSLPASLNLLRTFDRHHKPSMTDSTLIISDFRTNAFFNETN